ncbi:MAG TPA: hypothetical protein VK137_13410 [Planctomycetaceae bacterium]|nr:hypothetical protein [Planctomycetaceae bacterium]
MTTPSPPLPSLPAFRVPAFLEQLVRGLPPVDVSDRPKAVELQFVGPPVVVDSGTRTSGIGLNCAFPTSQMTPQAASPDHPPPKMVVNHKSWLAYVLN